MNDNFVEEFFDSDMYKNIIARNDQTEQYIVETTSSSTYFLDGINNICKELHFQEEIDMHLKAI
jgi:hypothetical protein